MESKGMARLHQDEGNHVYASWSVVVVMVVRVKKREMCVTGVYHREK